MKTNIRILLHKVMPLALFVSIAVAGAATFTACQKSNVDAAPQQVETTELVRTSQSWDGAELPDYPQGRPEIVGVKYVIPAGQKLGIHFHPCLNFGVLVQGELTIVAEDGPTKTVHEGEAIVEMVDTIHHGENRGTKPVVLYMFYTSQKDQPLSVPYTGEQAE